MKNLFVPITIMPGKSGKSMASAGMTRMALGKNMSKAYSAKCPNCGKNEKNCSCQRNSSRQMSKGLRKADNPSVWEQITNAARQASDYASPYMQQASNYASPYIQQASNYAAPYVQNAKNNTRRAIQSVKSGYYGSLLPELALLQNEWKKGGPAQSGLIESAPVDSTGRTITMPAYTMGDIGNRLKTFGLPSRVKQNQYNDITERERSFAPLRALGEYLSPTQNLGMSMTGPAGLPRNYRTSLRDTMGVSPETVIGGAGTPRIGGELVRRYSDADIRRMMAPARMKNEYTVQGKAVKPRNQIWNTGTMRPDVNPFETFVAPKPQPTYNRAKGRWDTNIPSNVAEPVSEYERKQKAPRRDVQVRVPARPTLTGLITNENYINMGKSMSKSMQKGRFSQLAQSIGRSLGSAGRKMRRNVAIGLEQLKHGDDMRYIKPWQESPLQAVRRREAKYNVPVQGNWGEMPQFGVASHTVNRPSWQSKHDIVHEYNDDNIMNYAAVPSALVQGKLKGIGVKPKTIFNPDKAPLTYYPYDPTIRSNRDAAMLVQNSADRTRRNATNLLSRASNNAKVNNKTLLRLAGLVGGLGGATLAMASQKQTEPSPYGRPMGKSMSKASNPNDPENPYRRKSPYRQMDNDPITSQRARNSYAGLDAIERELSGWQRMGLPNTKMRVNFDTIGNPKTGFLIPTGEGAKGDMYVTASNAPAKSYPSRGGAARKSMSKSITSVQRSGTRHVVGGLRNGSMAKRANTSNKYFN